MIRNFYYDAMDADTILNMVFNLLAAYVGMLNVLVREYYFDKGRFPDNLDMYASLFKELLDEHFLKMVGDYLVARKGLTVNETIKSIQTQKLLVMNAVLQYEDQKDILKIAGTKDKYLSLMKISDIYAKEEIDCLIPYVKKHTGIEDCEETLHKMFGMKQSSAMAQ